MEEDLDDEAIARKMQEELYGGAGGHGDSVAAGQMGANMNQQMMDELAIRKADSGKVSQLIGGDDDSEMPYGLHMQR